VHDTGQRPDHHFRLPECNPNQHLPPLGGTISAIGISSQKDVPSDFHYVFTKPPSTGTQQKGKNDVIQPNH
jgi:hypothetical protein